LDFGVFIRSYPLALRWRITRLADDVGWQIGDRYFSVRKRRKLKNRDFTVISNDCVAGVIYHRLGMPYLSPTIWTFIFPDEYLHLLGNLNWYLHQPLKFTAQGKHTCTVHDRLGRIKENCRYPVGILGGDVEIHFLHAKTQDEALGQWTRRLGRVNFDRLFCVLVDNEEYEFKEEYFEQFERLPLEQKLFLSKKPRNSCPYAVVVKNKMHIERSFDLVKWLNCELSWQTKAVVQKQPVLTPLHQIKEVTV
jgi:uncharacterized protein (DUF1919 family)